MIALLHAQRGEAARRAREVRGSSRWVDSSNRLDNLNNQIMHEGTFDLSTDPPRNEPAPAQRRPSRGPAAP